jgi:hypothetical protein
VAVNDIKLVVVDCIDAVQDRSKLQAGITRAVFLLGCRMDYLSQTGKESASFHTVLSGFGTLYTLEFKTFSDLFAYVQNCTSLSVRIAVNNARSSASTRLYV